MNSEMLSPDCNSEVMVLALKYDSFEESAKSSRFAK